MRGEVEIEGRSKGQRVGARRCSEGSLDLTFLIWQVQRGVSLHEQRPAR
jgi:hypothetical protein